MDALVREVIVKALLYFVITVALGVWTYALLPLLKSVLEKLRQNEEFKLVEKAAEIAVKAVEQIMGTDENKQKKHEAMKKALEYLSGRLNTDLNMELISDAIEKAVKTMKDTPAQINIKEDCPDDML